MQIIEVDFQRVKVSPKKDGTKWETYTVRASVDRDRNFSDRMVTADECIVKIDDIEMHVHYRDSYDGQHWIEFGVSLLETGINVAVGLIISKLLDIKCTLSRDVKFPAFGKSAADQEYKLDKEYKLEKLFLDQIRKTFPEHLSITSGPSSPVVVAESKPSAGAAATMFMDLTRDSSAAEAKPAAVVAAAAAEEVKPAAASPPAVLASQGSLKRPAAAADAVAPVQPPKKRRVDLFGDVNYGGLDLLSKKDFDKLCKKVQDELDVEEYVKDFCDFYGISPASYQAFCVVAMIYLLADRLEKIWRKRDEAGTEYIFVHACFIAFDHKVKGYLALCNELPEVQEHIKIMGDLFGVALAHWDLYTNGWAFRVGLGKKEDVVDEKLPVDKQDIDWHVCNMVRAAWKLCKKMKEDIAKKHPREDDEEFNTF